MRRAPCARHWTSSRRSRALRPHGRHRTCRPASASPPAGSSSARSAPARRRPNVRPAARRPTSRRGCRRRRRPGEIVIAGRDAQALGEAFELESLGGLDLKGFAAPVQAWRVLGERTAADALRGPAHARRWSIHRPRQRSRAAARALGPGARRRRPGRAALGRGRHRQVAHLPDPARAASRRIGGRRCCCSARPTSAAARCIRWCSIWSAQRAWRRRDTPRGPRTRSSSAWPARLTRQRPSWAACCG